MGHDREQKTRIKYNVPVSLAEAATACGTLDRRGDVILSDPDEFARLLGLAFQVPDFLKNRPVVARCDRRSIFLSVDGAKSEKDTVLPGWRYYRGKWECDLVDCLPEPTITYDEESVRQTTDEEKATTGLSATAAATGFPSRSRPSRATSKAKGIRTARLRRSSTTSWTTTSSCSAFPFAPEYLPGRIWNRFGAGLACQPEKGEFPHIQMILDHWGRNLDAEVAADEWCKINHVRTGGDYLMLWAAVIVRHPQVASALFVRSFQTAEHRQIDVPSHALPHVSRLEWLG